MWRARRNGSKSARGAAQLLLDAGADPNAKDVRGSTALHLASAGGLASETLELLLEHGARVNTRDRAGETPLGAARAAGQRGTIEFLESRGAHA